MKKEFWKAIVDCDRQYDGIFFYGVMTTGIFCRPSCCSKTPKKENVKIFSSKEEPIAQGFRPCKRCRPDLPIYTASKEQLIDQAVEVLDKDFAREISLTHLAEELFVSPFYLQKIFKSKLGISPTQYLTQKRIDKAKGLMAEGVLNMTEIALEVGFKSSAHFSAVFRKVVGHAPTEYREKYSVSHSKNSS